MTVPPGQRVRRSREAVLVTAAATALLVLAVVAAVVFWTHDDDAPGTSDPAPATVSAAPSIPAPAESADPAAPVAPPGTPGVTSAPPASPSQAQGTVVVSTRSVDLGSTASTGSFGIANVGDLPVLYQVSSRTPWLSVEPIGGQLPGEGGRRVDIRADRAAVPEGTARGVVVVSWDGGTETVHVHLVAGGTPTVPAGGRAR